MMKIGVMVESFRSGLDGGLKAAAEVGAHGVQIYDITLEPKPGQLSKSERTALRRKIEDHGLELSALCADFGGHGFQIAQDNPKRIEDSKRAMDLALDLGTRVVTTHIGVVPSDPQHPRYQVMHEACNELAKYAQKIGMTFAIETGPESASVLQAFLDKIGIPEGLGVNFDPANLVMVMREDIPSAVKKLGRYIVHTHAKDGVNLQPVNAEALYNSFAGDVIEGFNGADYIREVPLGQGGVHFPSYLKALREVGFDGYLTIEREVGENPRADIELAVNFLREHLATES